VRLGPGKADRERAARSVRRPQIAGEKSAPATAWSIRRARVD